VYKGPRSEGGPVMVMFHGGGYILGGLENEESLCRQWCKEFNGVSVNVDYRLAPDFIFPTAQYDAYDSVQWVSAHPNVHGGDLSKGFILAGISAGANLACTASHLARDDGLTPKITGLSLSIPSLMAPQAVPERWKDEYKSREENKDGLILNQDAIAFFRSRSRSPKPIQAGRS
jgi:acetyl esterase/lipase